MIEKKVNLRLDECAFPERIRVSQFDTMWRFVFGIVNNSQPWTIPAGASAVLNGRKPDGNVFAFSGTISDNKVTVDADVQMTAVAGKTDCELSILADGKTVGTANFILDVEAAPKSPDDVSSESTLPAYEEMFRIAGNIPADIPGYVADYLDEHKDILRPTDEQMESAAGEWLTNHPEAYAPTTEQATTAIDAWLDAHPEATTTVQDGSVTREKLSDALYSDLQDFDRKRMMIPAGKEIPFPGDGWYVPNPLFNQGNGDYRINNLKDANGNPITITRDSDGVVVATESWRYDFNGNNNCNYFCFAGTTLEHYNFVNFKFGDMFSFGSKTPTTYTLSAVPATILFTKQMAYNAVATVALDEYDKEITDGGVLKHLTDYVDKHSALSKLFTATPAVMTLRDTDSVTTAPDCFKKYPALDGLYFNNPTTSAAYPPFMVVFYDTDGNVVLPAGSAFAYTKKSAWIEIQPRITFEIKDGKIRFFQWFAHGAIPSVPLPSYLEVLQGWTDFERPLGYISMNGTYNCVYTDEAHEDVGEQYVGIDTTKNIGIADEMAMFAKDAIRAEFGDVSDFGRWLKSLFVYQMNRNRHSFRISTFNVARYGKAHWYRIKEFYKEHGVDIAGLQEVSYPLGDNSVSMSTVFSDYFKSWQFTEFSTNGDAYPTNERMFMSTSDYPIISTEEVYYKTQKIDSSGDHRYYTKCEFRMPKYRDKRGSEYLKMSVYNTQLEVSSPATTLAQAQELADVVKADPNPFKIVLGDTNDFGLDKPTWAVFESVGLHRVVDTNTATVSGVYDYNCIDNFFLSSRLQAIDYDVINAYDYMWEGTSGSSPLSDHDMVLADVKPDYSDIRCVTVRVRYGTVVVSAKGDVDAVDENGYVSAHDWLSATDTLTVRIAPDEGYKVGTITALDCQLKNEDGITISGDTITLIGENLIGDVRIGCTCTAV